jgi:hypothetical protein
MLASAEGFVVVSKGFSPERILSERKSPLTVGPMPVCILGAEASSGRFSRRKKRENDWVGPRAVAAEREAAAMHSRRRRGLQLHQRHRRRGFPLPRAASANGAGGGSGSRTLRLDEEGALRGKALLCRLCLALPQAALAAAAAPHPFYVAVSNRELLTAARRRSEVRSPRLRSLFIASPPISGAAGGAEKRGRKMHRRLWLRRRAAAVAAAAGSL